MVNTTTAVFSKGDMSHTTEGFVFHAQIACGPESMVALFVGDGVFSRSFF